MSGGWIVGLYLLGIALLVMEIFTPGLVMGILGIASLGASIWFLFDLYGPAAGAIGLAAGVAITVGIALFGMRRMRLARVQDLAKYSIADPELQALVGAEGVAVSPLRPAGVARFAGKDGDRRLDVITRGEMIDPGTPIRVVEVEGNRIVVRAK